MDTFNLPPFEPRKRPTSSPTNTHTTPDDNQPEHQPEHQQGQEEGQHDMPWFTTSASASGDALFGLAAVTAPSYTAPSGYGGYGGVVEQQQPGGMVQQPAQTHPQSDYYQQSPSTATGYQSAVPAYTSAYTSAYTNTNTSTNTSMAKSTSIPSIQNTLPPWEENAETRLAVDGEEPGFVLSPNAGSRHSSSAGSVSAGGSGGSVSAGGSVGSASGLPPHIPQPPSITTPNPPLQYPLAQSANTHSPYQPSPYSLPRRPSSPHQHQQQPAYQPPQPPTAEKYCTRCGTKNSVDANFCCRCGLQMVPSPTFPDFDAMSSMTSELDSMNIKSPVSPVPIVPSVPIVPVADSCPAYSGVSGGGVGGYNVDQQDQHHNQHDGGNTKEQPKQERVHPVVSFGFGGRIIYTLPQRQTRYSAATNSTIDCFRPGFLTISAVEVVCPTVSVDQEKATRGVPAGPFGEKTKPKELAKAILSVKAECDAEAFLLKLIGNGLDNNGQVMCLATERYVKDAFTVGPMEHVQRTPGDPTHAYSMLCAGDTAGAFAELLRVGSHGTAFAISAMVSNNAFSTCLQSFSDTIPDAVLLVLLFSGILPVDPFVERVCRVEWQTVVAVYVAHKGAAGKAVLQRLAECVGDEQISDIYTVLSTNRHTLRDDRLSELYEYMLMLTGQPPLPDLLSVKLKTASKCIDFSDSHRAHQYLQQLSTTDNPQLKRSLDLLQDRLDHTGGSKRAATQKTSIWSKFSLADAIVSSVIGGDGGGGDVGAKKGDKKPLFTPEKSPIGTGYGAVAPPPPITSPSHSHPPQPAIPPITSPSHPHPPQPAHQQPSYQSFYSAYGSESETSTVPSTTSGQQPQPATTSGHHVKTTPYGHQHPIETPLYSGYNSDQPLLQHEQQQRLEVATPPDHTVQPQHHNSSMQQQPQYHTQYSPQSQSFGQSYSSFEQPGFDQHGYQPVPTTSHSSDSPQHEPTHAPASPAPMAKQAGGVLSILKSFISSTSSSPPAPTTPSSSHAPSATTALDKNQPTRANLGEQSKFRYDESLKRWVEEGAALEVAAVGVPSFPPVPMAPVPVLGGAAVGAEGKVEYRGIKKHFDPFNLAGQTVPAQSHEQPYKEPQPQLQPQPQLRPQYQQPQYQQEYQQQPQQEYQQPQYQQEYQQPQYEEATLF